MAKILDKELRKNILIDLATKKDTAIVFSNPEEMNDVMSFFKENGYEAESCKSKIEYDVIQWIIYFDGNKMYHKIICYYEDLGMIEAEDEKQSIDWEQRRYEIAKDVLGVLSSREGFTHDYGYNADTAIKYADELIKHLKA